MSINISSMPARTNAAQHAREGGVGLVQHDLHCRHEGLPLEDLFGNICSHALNELVGASFHNALDVPGQVVFRRRRLNVAKCVTAPYQDPSHRNTSA